MSDLNELLNDLEIPTNGEIDETEPDTQEDDFNLEPEIIDFDEYPGGTEEDEPEQEGGASEDDGGKDREQENQEYATLLAVVIDLVFSFSWGVWSGTDPRDYRLDAKGKKELIQALIPLMGDMKEQLSEGWLLVFTLLALQMGNGMKAYEARVKKKKAPKTKVKDQKKYENAEDAEFEILEDEPPKKYGADGKKQATKKRCSVCGKFGHTKPTCPDNPKNQEIEIEPKK